MMPKPAEPPQTTQRAFEGWWYRWHFIQDRNSDGNLYVRYLYWNDDRWNWNNNWLDSNFNDNNPTVVPANHFISLPNFWESFVLLAARSNRQAFYQFHPVVQIMRRIFYYLNP